MEKVYFYSRGPFYKSLLPQIFAFVLLSVQCYVHWFSWLWSSCLIILVILWVSAILISKKHESKVIIELNQEGIVNHFTQQTVRWRNISSLKMYYEDTISIHLVDDSAYQPKNWWQELVYRRKIWLYKTPVYISTAGLQGKPYDNYNKMFDYMEAVELRNTGVQAC